MWDSGLDRFSPRLEDAPYRRRLILWTCGEEQGLSFALSGRTVGRSCSYLCP